MYKKSIPILLLLILGVTGQVSAAPSLSERPDGPMIIGQAQSLEKIIQLLKEAFKKMIPGKVSDALFSQFDPKVIEGVDFKRPIGIYGHIDPSFSNSYLVILIPVTDEKALLATLQKTEAVMIGEPQEGIRELHLGEFPLPMLLRIDKGYAKLAFGSRDAIKKPIEVKDLIDDKDKSLATVTLRLNRIPADQRNQLLKNFKEQADSLAELGAEDFREVRNIVGKYTQRVVKQLLAEGRDLTTRLVIEPKTSEVYVELEIEGLPKTALANDIASRAPTMNAFGSLLSKDNVAQMALKMPLFSPEIREAYSKSIDVALKLFAMSNELNKEGADAFKTFMASVQSTIEAGNLDGALVFRGPDKDGAHCLLGGIQLRDARKVEKDLIAFLKTQNFNDVQYNVEKVGNLNVHVNDFKSDPPPEEVRAVFGKDPKFYFAFDDHAVYACFGSQGAQPLLDVQKAKPAPAPAFDISIQGKKLAAVLMKMPIADVNGPQKELIENLSSYDQFSVARIDVTGGERLKIRVSLGLQYVAAMSYAGGGADFKD